MGTLIAEDVIARANEIAQDEAGVTWRSDQALEWLNDAQRVIVMLRPDANIQVNIPLLIPGSRQSINGDRLVSITRNMGYTGTVPGRAIRLVDRGAKDDYDPMWSASVPVSPEINEVREYMYDERTPKIFYVYPPISSYLLGVRVETFQSFSPSDVAHKLYSINIDDKYAPAMIEWIAYRFFSRDAEEMPELQRAVSHFQRFFALMDKKLSVDLAISPKVRSQLE